MDLVPTKNILVYIILSSFLFQMGFLAESANQARGLLLLIFIDKFHLSLEMSCWLCANPNFRSLQFDACFFFMGFLIGWCVTGGVAERDGTILRTISAAGSRTTSCRTSASWDCSMSTWRWVRYFAEIVYNTEFISGQKSKIIGHTKYEFMDYKSQIFTETTVVFFSIPILHFPVLNFFFFFFYH